MKDHSEKGSKLEKSPNKEKIQFYKVYNQLRQHDDFIDDIVYDVDKLTQKASLYYKKINSIIDDIISSIEQDLLADMDKNNPPKFDLERISEAFQNKWAEHKTIAEENQKRIYIEATNLIKEHADAMQQEGGYSDEDKVKDILVRRQKLKDRVKKTQEIMDKLLDSSRGGEKDKISDSVRLALEKEKAYSKPLAEWNWRDRLVGSKLSVSSYGILTSDNNEGSKKEDIIEEASYIATSGDADLWESGEKPLEEVYKQYNDTIARIDKDLKAIAKSPSSSKGFERHDDNDFYVYMNKVQEGIEPLTKGSHRCFHIIDNKVNNIKMKLIRNRRDSEEWEES